MHTVEKSSKNQTERQKEIVEVAMDIIANKGIQGMTIKNLSKAIGISEPAIYRHFDSKTNILMSILNNFREMAVMLSGMLDNYKGTAIEKLDFMFSNMISLFSANPSILSVIFSEEIFKNDEMLKSRIVEILNLHASTIENIISKGQQQNNVRTDLDAKSLTLLAMGALRLLVKRWDLNNHNFDLEQEGKKLIQVLDKILHS